MLVHQVLTVDDGVSKGPTLVDDGLFDGSDEIGLRDFILLGSEDEILFPKGPLDHGEEVLDRVARALLGDVEYR